jgi:hypothetical protein
MASHGVVSTGALTPESFGLDNPETTPLSIPTNPATPPDEFRRLCIAMGGYKTLGENRVMSVSNRFFEQ